MRKSAQSVFLAMSAFAALSFSAAAVAQEGAYIQGDIGLGHLKVDDNEKLRVSNVGRKIKDSYHESGFMPRLSVGYALGNGLRVAGDFTHYKEMKESYDAANGATQNAGVKANGFGLSAIYDFDYGSDFVPYVGGRIAANKLKYSAGYAAAGPPLSPHEHQRPRRHLHPARVLSQAVQRDDAGCRVPLQPHGFRPERPRGVGGSAVLLQLIHGGLWQSVSDADCRSPGRNISLRAVADTGCIEQCANAPPCPAAAPAATKPPRYHDRHQDAFPFKRTTL